MTAANSQPGARRFQPSKPSGVLEGLRNPVPPGAFPLSGGVWGVNPAEIETLQRRAKALGEENARLRVLVEAGTSRRKEAEIALAESEERYRTLFNSIDEGFCIIEFFDGPHGPLSDYVHVEANPAYALHAGIPNVVGQKLREMVADEADGWAALYGEVLRSGKPIRFERELIATGRHLELAAFRIEPASRRQVAVLFQDITARKRAETALRELNETLETRVAEAISERQRVQDELRQAQKMEAVGQLTGGIAHDFNNLLTGIMGSLDLLRTRLSQGRLSEIDRYVTAAQGACKRAAALTHRLLAFSRRQTLDPKPTDVNRLVKGMEELIRRTVGPQITLEVVTAVGLWPALVDASQLESALLNLAINARDAMPDGGRITIETANRWLDERAANERDLPAGQYLSLCVTDTGVGMTRDVIARAFDPFYTTKPIGQGTGLGLSMVYGFVRQSGGQVRIYSELGQGTTMCLYFPRHYRGEAETSSGVEQTTRAPAQTGKTVLIVDDEPTVRMLVLEVLDELGFTGIEAKDGPAGLRVLQSDARVDLLITDVGLPGGMNGRQLADAARTTRPDLPILFITGYAENAIIGNAQLAPGMRVLTKPFVVETLARRLLETIED
ncbi:ATP-binding protein [Bradyrhizobium lablabi]|uniref:ATP-binding protein n=1 Tax=Bradyrhizobium lablabi TaxID=722472 RepID=UPI0020128B13|nr:ATP-binding protein [Bradyrhizobium lablabi]